MFHNLVNVNEINPALYLHMLHVACVGSDVIVFFELFVFIIVCVGVAVVIVIGVL